jgi:hypothetical protein
MANIKKIENKIDFVFGILYIIVGFSIVLFSFLFARSSYIDICGDSISSIFLVSVGWLMIFWGIRCRRKSTTYEEFEKK